MAGFKKVLGYKVILLITLNSIIGSGMFFLPAIGARIAGPASILAWLILALSSIYTAMIFAEMVAMYPKAGGVYEFCKQAYGSFVSFIVGWIAWIVGNVTTAMLIVGAIQYLLPQNTGGFILAKLLISLFWVFVFNAMAYRGMKTSSFMLVTFAFITVSIVLALIVPSFFFIDASNLDPFFIGTDMFANLSLIVVTIFFISEAFFGLESVMFLAEEVKNPEKVLPKALVHGTVIIAVLTMVLVTVSLMVLPHEMFGVSDAPFALLANMTLGGGFENVIIIGTFLVIIGAAAGWIVTGPRLIVSLTRDKMFPPKFGRIHPVYDSPSNAIIFQAFVTGVLVVVGMFGEGYTTLLAILVPLVKVMMTAAIMAVVVLRIKKPYLHRPYKAPFAILGAILLTLTNIALVIVWLVVEHDALSILNIGLALIFLGVPIYLFLQTQYNPVSLTCVHEWLAHFTLFFEKYSRPKYIREKCISLVGGVEGKNVLELGYGVGTFTLYLADKIGWDGELISTGQSHKLASLLRSRVEQNDLRNVTVHEDMEYPRRVHPDVPKVDVVVSYLGIGNLARVDSVLADINNRLKNGSKICFVEYDNYFRIMSNINWLSNEYLIKHMFKRNGFDVHIERERGLFWDTLYIYGTKFKKVTHPDIGEKIDLEELGQDVTTVHNLHEFIRQKIVDYKEKIIKKEIAFVMFDDPKIDELNFSVNSNYFGRIFSSLLDIGTSYCPPNGDVIILVETKKEKLNVSFYLQMDEQMLSAFVSQSIDAIDFIHRDRVREISYVERVVTLGYKGDVEITKIREDFDPTVHKHHREFVLGVFEEKVIEKDQNYLKIGLSLPFDRILE